MNVTQKNLIYMLSCAVNNITPDTASVNTIDLEELYGLAKYHMVRGVICIALERTGIQEKHFHESYKKAIRKNIYFDIERSAIIDDFEKHEIWYMPLKGAVLKEMYPENGMREMSDNDMLYDLTKREQVREIMLSRGYAAKSIGFNHHDIYHKPPVLNFELHTTLFDASHSDPLYKYYSNIKRLLIKDNNNRFGYHLSGEDFYVYITAHEWKHYNNFGTGIRSLLDCYIYCTAKNDKLDWNYIEEQCKQLEIADFEYKRRELAMKVFSSDKLPELTENEHEMLMYYLTAGTYGTFENNVRKKLKDQSKPSYILKSMFPSIDYMKRSVKFVEKCPILYPVGIIYRWNRILLKRRKHLSTIFKVMGKIDNDNLESPEKLMK